LISAALIAIVVVVVVAVTNCPMFRCGLRGGYCEVVNMDPDVKTQLLKSISAKLCSTVSGQVARGFRHLYVCTVDMLTIQLIQFIIGMLSAIGTSHGHGKPGAPVQWKHDGSSVLRQALHSSQLKYT